MTILLVSSGGFVSVTPASEFLQRPATLEDSSVYPLCWTEDLMQIHSGSRLGPYEILAPIGAGGMGEVYRARDTRLERDVAIKVLPEHLAGNEERKRRFEREAKTISQLQHPNVCTLYDVGSESGINFLVMEHLEGETLDSRLARGALPTDEGLEIGAAIGEAIHAAHQMGIVHRDLKPSNIMLTATGVKVLDFGLARREEGSSRGPEDPTATAAITREGSIVGTVPYMAPEQLQGKSVDARADIWALGCVLYEMTTGERPFRGESQADLIGSIMQSMPESPSTHHNLSSQQLDWLVLRCLEKDPKRRWQSAGELAVELRSLSGASQGRSARPRSRFRRILLAIATIVIIAGAAWWHFGQGQPSFSPAASPESDHLGNESEVSSNLFNKTSIAVLPFDNLTEDPEIEAVALGIPADFLTASAAVVGEANVVVPTREVAGDFSGPCDAAERLETEFVFGGTVRRTNDQVRVTAQLFDCPDAAPLWSKTMDGERNDLLNLQDQVVRSMWEETDQVRNFNGFYENRGSFRWHVGRLTKDDNAIALSMADDSGMYRLEAELQALSEGWAESPTDLLSKMQSIAEECLATKPSDWNCHFYQGYVAFLDGERELARSSMSNAVGLSGDIPMVRGNLAMVLATSGESDQAISILERAIRETPGDPMVPHWLNHLAIAYFAKADYDEARSASQRSLELNSRTPWNARANSHQMLAVCHALSGETDKARSHLENALELRPQLSAEWASVFYSVADPELRDRYLEGLRLAGLGD